MSLQQVEKEIKNLNSRVSESEIKFKKHLEIYADNGKELARLATIIEKLAPLFEKNNKQTEEMYTVFSGLMTTGTWSTRIVKWVFALIIGVGSLFIMVQQLNK